jgi:hypothetical protein
MEENRYEFDEHGGHKPIENSNGSTSIPILGCGSPGCKAAFFKPEARTLHIRATHPHMNSGPSEGMIQLARIRPELAKAFGMSDEEVNAPMNVQEFNHQQHIADVVDHQKKNWHLVTSHPIFQNVHAINAEANMLGAAMGQNDYGPEEVREMRDKVNQHLMQWAAGNVLGKSVEEPWRHIQKARSALEEGTWGLPDEQADHYNKTFDEVFDKAHTDEWEHFGKDKYESYD